MDKRAIKRAILGQLAAYLRERYPSTTFRRRISAVPMRHSAS